MTESNASNRTAALLRFAQRQSRDEVASQYSVAYRLERDRRRLETVAFAVAAFFLPTALCIVMWVLKSVSLSIGLRLLKDLDPPKEPGRYLAMLAAFLISTLCYSVLPALIWQLNLPLAKAFAVGSLLVAQMHISTVRTVHLPLGIVGELALIGSGAVSNSWYWVSMGDYYGLLVTSACVVAASYFAIINMQSIHALHDEMRRDRTAARDADQAKSRFLAQMSHELRTPLNAILGMGDAELAGAQTASQRERLSVLVQSARSLSVILDDILDLSAVQAGELPIRPRALDLRAEIASAVALFRQQIEDAGLRQYFSIHDGVPQYARLDGQRLRQCLSNILSNAVKHTQQGQISVYAYEQRSGMLAIKVADTGTGVPEALRDKIFDPFFRGQLNVPGTGLGMSIGRTLARRMGGDLVLLPSASGAHFLLTLAVEGAHAADVAVAERAKVGSLAGVRVLVVDDIATNRLVAITYLRQLGADPVEVAGGAEALEHLAGLAAEAFTTAKPVPIILLDLLMPEMDGVETLRRIRALPQVGRQIIVVAMSADATGPFLHKGALSYKPNANDEDDGHFDGFVAKPLSMESLGAILLPLVRRAAHGDTAGS